MKFELYFKKHFLLAISGVYDIADHFKFEAGRGVEDISTMGKAMYGREYFNRFSPTHVIEQLPGYMK